MLELFEKYTINKPVRLIELFAGYGSQALALENLGVEFEHHQVIEFDKYAIQSYNALHGTNFETRDITKVHDLNIVDKDKYEYIMTYSFPCQDLSLAGKGGGMGKGTRSGLLWEVERLLKENALPQVLIMENVTQIHSVKHIEDFRKWIQFLAKMGYSNQWKDLNAKDYGIPQNRNRTFMVSILGDYEYHFPKPLELQLRLKDMLEADAEEKYYLSEEIISSYGFAFEPTRGGTIANAVTTKNGSRMHDNFILDHIGNIDIGNNESEEYANAPTTVGKNSMAYINIPEATKKGYKEAHEGDGVYIDRPHQKRGTVQKDMIQTLKTSGEDVGVVVKSHNYKAVLAKALAKELALRIRKLTPRECFRLMGLSDSQIDKIQSTGISDPQQYKQAGNSIVVPVLESIFKEMIL